MDDECQSLGDEFDSVETLDQDSRDLEKRAVAGETRRVVTNAQSFPENTNSKYCAGMVEYQTTNTARGVGATLTASRSATLS